MATAAGSRIPDSRTMRICSMRPKVASSIAIASFDERRSAARARLMRRASTSMPSDWSLRTA
jgi:hypothetical protein